MVPWGRTQDKVREGKWERDTNMSHRKRRGGENEEKFFFFFYHRYNHSFMTNPADADHVPVSHSFGKQFTFKGFTQTAGSMEHVVFHILSLKGR